MHTLILVCAGTSTRFPNYRPKWSLTHPNGNLMAVEALRGVRGYDRVVVAMRNEHLKNMSTESITREFSYGGYSAVSLVDVGDTKSQVETVRNAVRRLGLSRERFTVKDCDNQFTLELQQASANSIAVVDLHTVDLIKPANKSYILPGPGMTVRHVKERQILSPFFCCGAYTWESAEMFLECSRGTEYMSEAYTRLLDMGVRVGWQQAVGYEDWGTAQDWERYRSSYKTLFVDVDGVLVRSSHRSFPPTWGESESIAENVTALKKLHDTGRVEIILTTARPEQMREKTVKQLKKAGLQWHRLIMGLRNCERVLINDVVPARAGRTAKAVNLERNRNNLGQLLEA